MWIWSCATRSYTSTPNCQRHKTQHPPLGLNLNGITRLKFLNVVVHVKKRTADRETLSPFTPTACMPGRVPSHSMCSRTSRRSRYISAMPSTSLSGVTCKRSPRTSRKLTAQSRSRTASPRSTTSRTRRSMRSRLPA